MARAKCLAREQDGNQVDTELTIGMFYEVTDKAVPVYSNPELFVSLVGNSGVEISRPKRLFHIFKGNEELLDQQARDLVNRKLCHHWEKHVVSFMPGRMSDGSKGARHRRRKVSNVSIQKHGD